MFNIKDIEEFYHKIKHGDDSHREWLRSEFNKFFGLNIQESSQSMKLSIKRLSPDAVLPKYQSLGSAGFDLHAAKNYVLMPGETELIETHLAFETPVGYELQIRPRSGLSAKTKLRVLLGTVDSDYRGEVKVIIENIGSMVSIIDKGDRVAQAILAPIVQADIVEVEELGETERNSGGFGSTGR